MELRVIWEATETQLLKYSDWNAATKIQWPKTQQPKQSDWDTVTEIKISGHINGQF